MNDLTQEPKGFIYHPHTCTGLNPGRSFSACDGVGGGTTADGDFWCQTCGQRFRSRVNQIRDYLEAEREDGSREQALHDR